MVRLIGRANARESCTGPRLRGATRRPVPQTPAQWANRAAHLTSALPPDLPHPQPTFLGRLGSPNREYTARFNNLPSLVCPAQQEDAAARAAVGSVAELLKQELPITCRVRWLRAHGLQEVPCGYGSAPVATV